MNCGRCLDTCSGEEVLDSQPALDPVWMHEARREVDPPPTFAAMPGDDRGLGLDPTPTNDYKPPPVAPMRPSMHSVDSELPVEPVEFGVATHEEVKHEKKVHRHRMDELEVLDKAWWCCYFLCGGCGATEEPANTHFISKCICCRQTCEYVDPNAENTEGSCSFVHTCCCSVYLCQWPFREHTPVCICCASPCCGWHGKTRTGAQKKKKEVNRHDVTDGEVPPSMFDHVLQDTCMLWYCCGCGVACAGTILELYESFNKCACCRCTLGFSPPFAEDGCCAHLINCGRFHSQCYFPIKKESNPLIACCGTRCRKVHPHGRNIGVGVAASNKPRQQEMR